MKYQITRQIRIDNGLGFEGTSDSEVLFETDELKEAKKALEKILFENYERWVLSTDTEYHIEYEFYCIEEVCEDRLEDIDWVIFWRN